MLNFLYGNLEQPAATIGGELTTFDQAEFVTADSPETISMDSTGYVYTPSACLNETSVCRLHVAMHGCDMGVWVSRFNNMSRTKL